jgi:hypothetical protein
MKKNKKYSRRVNALNQKRFPLATHAAGCDTTDDVRKLRSYMGDDVRKLRSYMGAQ